MQGGLPPWGSSRVGSCKGPGASAPGIPELFVLRESLFSVAIADATYLVSKE